MRSTVILVSVLKDGVVFAGTEESHLVTWLHMSGR